MKGTLITIIIIALVAIGGAFVYLQFNNDFVKKTDADSSKDIISNNQPVPENLGGNSQVKETEVYSPETYNIDIKNFAFSPSTLTIKRGDKVTWTNQDSVMHTVTSDSGNELDSDSLSKGKSYIHTFNKIGTFDYHCSPHPNMKARIIVE